MDFNKEIIIALGGFLIIALSSNHISKFFAKIKFPLITGLLVAGVLAGPDVLGLIPSENSKSLNFLNEISLAFIAFAAGSELYLKEIRGQFKSILWNTVGQLVITFGLGVVGVFLVSDYIPFMAGPGVGERISIESKDSLPKEALNKLDFVKYVKTDSVGCYTLVTNQNEAFSDTILKVCQNANVSISIVKICSVNIGVGELISIESKDSLPKEDLNKLDFVKYVKTDSAGYYTLVTNKNGQFREKILEVCEEANVSISITKRDSVKEKMDFSSKMAIAILMATIFVARSPSSAVAVINELRAKGPFTQTAIGVTVVKDVLVIILFAVCFALAKTFLSGEAFSLMSLGYLLVELVVSFGLGRLLGILIKWFFKFKMNKQLKVSILIALGYSVYLFAAWLGEFTEQDHILGHKFYIEPLLICILGSYYVTNYSTSRPEFALILHETGPLIYVIFFTLTGASLELNVLASVFGIAVIFFFVRLLGMVLGGYVGGALASDPWKFRHLNWMPYVTQAGVGLGLATLIKHAFPEFETIIVGVIVINQVVGPPLFKYALYKVKETHEKHDTPDFDGHNDAIIFGFEPMSLALARQLKNNGWGVKIAAMKRADEIESVDDIDIVFMDSISLECLNKLDPIAADTMVLMLSDRENFKWCELIYEEIGTKEIVVRSSGDRYYARKFKELDVLLVDPSSAMVNLMDHFVRSPNATSILLGMETDQDAIDIEIIDPTIQGYALRDLRLPSDILILSIARNGQMMITHGYTRLRVGDIVTILGSQESIDKVDLMFGPT